MKSNVAVTYQIDDIDLAVDELLGGVLDGFSLLENSVGILFCYSDMDSAELAKKLYDRAGFDVLGCTGIASMDQKDGFHSMAATFMVLTADDCRFATVSTAAITADNVQQAMQAAYDEVCAGLSGEPGLVFSLPPYILEVMLDAYTNAFNAIAPGVPVVGGLPSYNATGDENLVFLNGAAADDRLVMLAIGGNVRPVFSVQNVGARDASRKRKVTKAVNNTVYEVNNQKFTDYLAEIGLPVEVLAQGNATITFVSNPVLVENHGQGGDFSFARTLHEINLDGGYGVAIGEIPLGSTISISTLERSEIEEKAAAGMEEIKQRIADSGDYEYSSLLAISCIGRHLLLLPESDAEAKNLLSGFPQGLSMAGFYSYGEIGPQGEGAARNFAHNESLVLCAF